MAGSGVGGSVTGGSVTGGSVTGGSVTGASVVPGLSAHSSVETITFPFGRVESHGTDSPPNVIMWEQLPYVGLPEARSQTHWIFC